MEKLIKIGTSGYNYFWNKGKPTPFKWYIKQGFNTVEINATFYSFPYKSWIKSWLDSPDYFDFSIKVNRTITHYSRLSQKGIELFSKFKNSLNEIEDKISFWLFQMPPTFELNEKNLAKIEIFFRKINLENKVVIEFRDESWFKDDKIIHILNQIGIVFCSIDAPEFPNEIYESNGIIYLRLHGRKEWYSYEYSKEELDEIVSKILNKDFSKCYIYLNNDHGMLPNGFYLMDKLGLKRSSV
jgi:Uncharacterized conserved protein